MSANAQPIIYCWRPSPDNRHIIINTTRGSYINTISVPPYTSAVIQNDELILTLKTGQTWVTTVRGSYKGSF